MDPQISGSPGFSSHSPGSPGLNHLGRSGFNSHGAGPSGLNSLGTGWSVLNPHEEGSSGVGAGHPHGPGLSKGVRIVRPKNVLRVTSMEESRKELTIDLTPKSGATPVSVTTPDMEEYRVKTQSLGFVETRGNPEIPGNATLDASTSPTVNAKKEKQPWNSFKAPRRVIVRSSDESGGLETPKKILKLLCYIVTFTLVLGTACMANVTLLLMTSQVPEKRTQDLCLDGANKHYVVTTSPSERTGWLFSLWICLVASEVIIFFISIWTCIYKSWDRPSVQTFLLVFITESLHALGLSLLVFFILREQSSIQALMLMNSLNLVPAVLFASSRKFNGVGSYLKAIPGFIIFVYLILLPWLLPVERRLPISAAAVLTSFGWWENFVHPEKGFLLNKQLGIASKHLQSENRHYFARLIICPSKIAIFTITLFVCLDDLGDAFRLLSDLSSSFTDQVVTIVQKWQTSESAVEGIRGVDLTSNGHLPLYLALVQVASSHLCYMASFFACRIKIDQTAFSLPVSLAAPVTVVILSTLCSYRMGKECFMNEIFPEYVFWTCPSGDFVKIFLVEQHGWTWILLMCAQFWITSYIWSSETWKRDQSEGYFLSPTYLSPAICQSLLFNKRQHFQTTKEDQVNIKNNDKSSDYAPFKPLKEMPRAKVYGCATMWHETKEEMKAIIKSIMNLDVELSEKRESNNPSKNYDFELHIFFDNAFDKKPQEKEIETPDGKKTVPLNSSVYLVNNYVKDLVEVMKKSGQNVYTKKEDEKKEKKKKEKKTSEAFKKAGQQGTEPPKSEKEDDINRINDPVKIKTPYGGRLVWTLPHNTIICAHLKDSEEIRRKKRWSQVMYMYYLLGYQIREQRKEEEWGDLERNTFILALDGDIDFQPDAISKLLDLMLRDVKLGAACGRIHPVGTGLMVWYQKFEYAIGHWLQKATEHVLGCVLCSPGCFSLFRAEALVQVMKQYSSKAELPQHRLQYDQGEDRWLCTLILKQGYRIEYSAASDSYTNCPDSFQEFYTQRKRWGPSTMANIFDLISDYRATVKNNDFISRPYIMYQLIMMIGSLIGPGTIFLMIVGAMIAAFQVTSWVAFLANIFPVTMFAITCFFAKEKYQLVFAMFLSSLYALLMLAVLVGTCIQLQEEGLSSPSGVFLVAMASSFIVAGLLHPQEILCLVHGVLYFLLVPSMYLLLNIYSLINLYDISWGTREDTNAKAQETAQNKEEQKKHNTSVLDGLTKWMGMSDKSGPVSRINFCTCCGVEKKESPEEVKLLGKNSQDIEHISKKIDAFEKNTQVIVEALSRCTPGLQNVHPGTSPDSPALQPSAAELRRQELESPRHERSESKPKDTVTKDKSSWLHDPKLLNGAEGNLSAQETAFWVEMIKKYLVPVIDNPETKQKGTLELKMLRNKVVFLFLMMNSFFILVVFLLQINKDQLFITWPVNYKANMTYIPSANAVIITKDFMRLEPVGLVFAGVFGILLILQFTGMIFHRFATFTHIMAGTSLSSKDTVKKAKEYEDADDEEDEDEDDKERRKSIFARHFASKRRSTIANLFSKKKKKRHTGSNSVEMHSRNGSISSGTGSVLSSLSQRGIIPEEIL